MRAVADLFRLSQMIFSLVITSRFHIVPYHGNRSLVCFKCFSCSNTILYSDNEYLNRSFVHLTWQAGDFQH